MSRLYTEREYRLGQRGAAARMYNRMNFPASMLPVEAFLAKWFPLTETQPRVVTLHNGAQYQRDLLTDRMLVKMAGYQGFSPGGTSTEALQAYQRLLKIWEPGILVTLDVPDNGRTTIDERGALYRHGQEGTMWWTLADLRLIVSLLDEPTVEVEI